MAHNDLIANSTAQRHVTAMMPPFHNISNSDEANIFLKQHTYALPCF